MKEEARVVSVICLLFGVIAVAGAVTQVDFSLSSRAYFHNPKILYVGGIGPNNYSTIQAAIDNSTSGDTIFVYDDSSPYHESIVLNKPVNLVGEKRETTIIAGEEGEEVVYITADGVSIGGFTILGQNKSHIGIRVHSDNNTISNTTICYNKYGIALTHCHSNIIYNSTIFTTEVNWSYGIKLQNSTANVIDGNLIKLTYTAIEAIHSHKNIISNNTIYNNSLGIFLLNSHNNKVFYNNISNSGSDILCLNSDGNLLSSNFIIGVGEMGIGLDTSNRSNILHNFISAKKYGIGLIDSSSFNNIYGNEITSCSRAVYLSNARENNISENVIHDNRIGIFLHWLSTHNIISKNELLDSNVGILLNDSFYDIIEYNDFINNSRQAMFYFIEIYLYRSFSNHWNGNYWSNWRTMLPKPIIGYGKWLHVPLLNFDWHPAREPYG